MLMTERGRAVLDVNVGDVVVRDDMVVRYDVVVRDHRGGVRRTSGDSERQSCRNPCSGI
jgi:hypothetical protein